MGFAHRSRAELPEFKKTFEELDEGAFAIIDWLLGHGTPVDGADVCGKPHNYFCGL